MQHCVINSTESLQMERCPRTSFTGPTVDQLHKHLQKVGVERDQKHVLLGTGDISSSQCWGEKKETPSVALQYINSLVILS